MTEEQIVMDNIKARDLNSWIKKLLSNRIKRVSIQTYSFDVGSEPDSDTLIINCVCFTSKGTEIDVKIDLSKHETEELLNLCTRFWRCL